MKGWKGWLTSLGPDRVLPVTVATGAVLVVAVLYGHTQRCLEAARLEISRDLKNQAELLDGRFDLVVTQLEILRAQAGAFALAGSGAGGSPPSPLLSAFLESNPEEASTRLYSLDRMPPPFEADQLGNMVALNTMAARRRPGLARPDPSGWVRDAALGLELLPAMAGIRAGMPDLPRIYFGAATGVVAFSPWEPSAASSLLDSYPVGPVYRAAARAGDAAPLWSLVAAAGPATGAAVEGPSQPRAMGMAPEQYSTVGLPLTKNGAFVGIVAAQIDLAEVLRNLGPSQHEAGRLILTDRDGRVLAETTGTDAAPPTPIPSAAVMAGLDSETAAHGGLYLSATALDRAPLMLVHAVPRNAVLLPTLLRDFGSLGLLALLLALVLALSLRMMRRAVAERESAVTAERTVRAASERALDDLRAAHDELDFLNREKTRFFSLISHDLRGPFNALLGMTQELAEHAPQMTPEDVSDFARTTHQSARKVFELLENLLQWSRVQMSGKPFAPSVFALRDLVADAIRDVQSAAEAKDITVLDAVGDRWVLADRTMILAVLRNLLVNAVKFSHPGGLVHITSRALGDRLEVAVTDRGIGMEPEQVQALLHPGAGQASRPGTQGEVGTGLGLTLVRDLVLRHGGELKVSSSPADGTVVSFTVPLTAAGAEQRARIPVIAE